MKKVLIVDDDTDINDLLSLIITNAGWEAVQTFKDKSIVEVTRIDPDVILLDHVLNGGSGSEAGGNDGGSAMDADGHESYDRRLSQRAQPGIGSFWK